jgi:hypothetical protein
MVSQAVSKPLAPLGLGAVLICAHLSACTPSEPPLTTESDSAGVSIVQNGGPDRSMDMTAVEVAEFQSPDSALTAVPWGVVADSNTGQLYVLDWTGQRVAVFGPTGGHLGWIGRSGKGPGEFRSPVAIALDEDGTLHVLDAGRGMIIRFANGDLINEVRAPTDFWGPGMAVSPDGLLYVTSTSAGATQSQTLARQTPEGTLPVYSMTRELAAMDLPCGRFSGHKVFSPDLVWSVGGDTTFVRREPGYGIDVLVGDSLVSSYRRALEPIRVTMSMAEARVRAGPYSRLLQRCGASAAQIVAAAGHEDVVSPIIWLTLGANRQIWVTRSSNGIDPSEVDVLDVDGRYLGSLGAVGMPVAFPSPSTFVSIERDEMQMTTLSLYELRPRR